MAVGAGEVLGPDGIALGPIAVAVASEAEAAAEAVATAGRGRIHESGEGPFGLLLIVGREGDFAEVVLDAGEVAERAVEGEHGSDECGTAGQAPDKRHGLWAQDSRVGQTIGWCRLPTAGLADHERRWSALLEFRIHCDDAGDFFGLAGGEDFVGVEAPDSFEEALAAEDFVDSGDAASIVV